MENQIIYLPREEGREGEGRGRAWHKAIDSLMFLLSIPTLSPLRSSPNLLDCYAALLLSGEVRVLSIC